MSKHILSSIICEIFTSVGIVVVVYSVFGVFWAGLAMITIGLIEGLDSVCSK